MASDPFDLSGKVAIVTGAGGGIGKASAERLVERGGRSSASTSRTRT